MHLDRRAYSESGRGTGSLREHDRLGWLGLLIDWVGCSRWSYSSSSSNYDGSESNNYQFSFSRVLPERLWQQISYLRLTVPVLSSGRPRWIHRRNRSFAKVPLSINTRRSVQEKASLHSIRSITSTHTGTRQMNEEWRNRREDSSQGFCTCFNCFNEERATWRWREYCTTDVRSKIQWEVKWIRRRIQLWACRRISPRRQRRQQPEGPRANEYNRSCIGIDMITKSTYRVTAHWVRKYTCVYNSQSLDSLYLQTFIHNFTDRAGRHRVIDRFGVLTDMSDEFRITRFEEIFHRHVGYNRTFW